MRKWLKKNGQSTLEYAVLIVVIIAALVAMQVYLKRGVQGKLRESADQIGTQFSPGQTTGNITTTTGGTITETLAANVMTTQYTDQYQNRTGTENVGNASVEYWGRD